MGELVSMYMIGGAPTAKLVAQAEVSEAEPFDEEQSGKWAKIIAAVIFIIALILMPTFFVDDDQYESHSSKVVMQVKGTG